MFNRDFSMKRISRDKLLFSMLLDHREDYRTKNNLHSSTKSADYLILYIFEKTWYLCKSECYKYVSELFSEICVKLFNGILIELFDRYNTVLYRIYFSGHPVYIIYRINKRRIAILCSKNRISAHIVQPIRDAWILIWQIRKNW